MIKKRKHLNQRIHAKARFKERFNLDLTTEQLNQMVVQIQEGRAEHIEQSSRRASVWRIHYLDQIFEVVYDSKRRNIVTVFPFTKGDNPTNDHP